MSAELNLTLKVWRQKSPQARGEFRTYKLRGISEEMSFLEMLDVLNEQLVQAGEEPIAFDHDCREGICGSCGMMINGQAHGPEKTTTTCQLHMRKFRNNDTIVIEPWRAAAFPVIKDLAVDRSAFDRIQSAGGFTSVNVGNAPDGNAMLVPKPNADKAFEAATCLGCGACVAACKNASAMLFVSAKVSQFALLPQGAPERERRVLSMVATMDEEGFGGCTNTNECEAACPVGSKVDNIAQLNREVLNATIVGGA